MEPVLLTHAHPDHTGFAEPARVEAGAVVRIHEDDAESARTGRRAKPEGSMLPYLRRGEMYRTLFSLLRRGGARMIPIAELSTFRDGEVIDVPGRPRVVHAPGHTAGSAALHLPGARVVATGDALVTPTR